jgi:hypothetical protein
MAKNQVKGRVIVCMKNLKDLKLGVMIYRLIVVLNQVKELV